MKIKVYVKNDRSVSYSTFVIGKVLENEASILEFYLTDKMKDNDLYIEFEKPDGSKFVTPKLEILTSQTLKEEVVIDEVYYVDYPIPRSLLDSKGDLKCELVLRNNEDLVFKSNTITFTIFESINASEEIPEKSPDFVSEAQKVIDSFKSDGVGDKYLSDDGTYKEVNPKFDETDPTVPSHVKEITEDDISNWNNKSEFSGNYDDLNGKPIIPSVPTNISSFENDKGYLTEEDVNVLINNSLGVISEELATLTTVGGGD